MQTHTDIKNQRMNLNNGDKKKKFRSTLNVTKQAPKVTKKALLIVTIVEIHMLIIDVSHKKKKKN